GLFANARVDAAGRARAASLLASAGQTVWIEDEALMDAVTATSGSGPAYVFLLAEAMEDAAVAQGLPPDAARILAQQTILGAARMLTESGEPPAELRRRVTSPNGTTQAAIETFEAGGFRELVAGAIAAAAQRGARLSADNDGARAAPAMGTGPACAVAAGSLRRRARRPGRSRGAGDGLAPGRRTGAGRPAHQRERRADRRPEPPYRRSLWRDAGPG